MSKDPFEYLLEKMDEDYGKPKEERRNDKILENAAKVLRVAEKLKENKNEK